MIDLNLYNHFLIKAQRSDFLYNDKDMIIENYYKCLKCNNIFWWQDEDSGEYYDDECVSYEFFIYKSALGYFGGICNLTCEELIIKGIIE